jgi:hypothetical protein
MPRISVYLPDDLADRLRSDGSGPTSQVVQEALRRYLGDSTGPSWAQPPADADQLLTAATEGLSRQAAVEFQDGYRAALKRLPDLDWVVLTSCARSHFVLEAWLKGWMNGITLEIGQGRNPEIPAWLGKLAKDVGTIADPIGFDEFSFRRTNAFERGYSAGLRAAYETVERGTSPGTVVDAPSES